MIAIDWSHTKELTTYDGKKLRVESRKALLKRIVSDNMGGESTRAMKSRATLQPPSVVLEQGCPLSLQYDLLKVGAIVSLIDNKATENYRKERDLVKTDEVDAQIIYELSVNGANLQAVTVDDKMIQMADVYNQYCRYQKARVSLQNMKKAHLRHYGSGTRESTRLVQSISVAHLVPDLLPYDIAIDALHGREKSLLKRLEVIGKGLPLFEAGGESIDSLQSTPTLQPPAIKGLGQRIWLGLMVTANPTSFKCLSAYLRYCGLTSDVMKTHKYNRHAKMLYHMLAEEVMKQKDSHFRPIYDKCKTDFINKHPEPETRNINGKSLKFYTKGHSHNAALNRTATFLAKYIYKSVRGESKNYF